MKTIISCKYRCNQKVWFLAYLSKEKHTIFQDYIKRIFTETEGTKQRTAYTAKKYPNNKFSEREVFDTKKDALAEVERLKNLTF